MGRMIKTDYRGIELVKCSKCGYEYPVCEHLCPQCGHDVIQIIYDGEPLEVHNGFTAAPTLKDALQQIFYKTSCVSKSECATCQLRKMCESI